MEKGRKRIIRFMSSAYKDFLKATNEENRRFHKGKYLAYERVAKDILGIDYEELISIQEEIKRQSE